jgi:hypothetical protein
MNCSEISNSSLRSRQLHFLSPPSRPPPRLIPDLSRTSPAFHWKTREKPGEQWEKSAFSPGQSQEENEKDDGQPDNA